MEEISLESKELGEQDNPNYGNLFDFLNPSAPAPAPASFSAPDPTAVSASVPKEQDFKKFTKRQLAEANYPFPCEQCDRRYLSEYKMKLHMGHIHGVKYYRCAICNDAFRLESQLQIHNLIHTTKKKKDPYECHVCEQSFPIKKFLQRHVAMHKDNSFPCPVTGCPDRLERNMYKHLREKHHISSEAPAGCKICAQKFASLQEFYHHTRSEHLGLKNGVEKRNQVRWDVPMCRFCNRTFNHHGDGIRHMMKHYQAGNSFECPQAWCQIKFGKFSELEAHLTKDHGLDKLENKRVCKKCGKGKRTWQSLVVHFHFGHFEEEKPVNSNISDQIDKQFSISNILNATNSSPESLTQTASPAPNQSIAAYNQLLLAVMCAYPTLIFPSLQSGSPSSSNLSGASSSTSSPECSEQSDLPPDPQ